MAATQDVSRCLNALNEAMSALSLDCLSVKNSLTLSLRALYELQEDMAFTGSAFLKRKQIGTTDDTPITATDSADSKQKEMLMASSSTLQYAGQVLLAVGEQLYSMANSTAPVPREITSLISGEHLMFQYRDQQFFVNAACNYVRQGLSKCFHNLSNSGLNTKALLEQDRLELITQDHFLQWMPYQDRLTVLYSRLRNQFEKYGPTFSWGDVPSGATCAAAQKEHSANDFEKEMELYEAATEVDYWKKFKVSSVCAYNAVEHDQVVLDRIQEHHSGAFQHNCTM